MEVHIDPTHTKARYMFYFNFCPALHHSIVGLQLLCVHTRNVPGTTALSGSALYVLFHFSSGFASLHSAFCFYYNGLIRGTCRVQRRFPEVIDTRTSAVCSNTHHRGLYFFHYCIYFIFPALRHVTLRT